MGRNGPGRQISRSETERRLEACLHLDIASSQAQTKEDGLSLIDSDVHSCCVPSGNCHTYTFFSQRRICCSVPIGPEKPSIQSGQETPLTSLSRTRFRGVGIWKAEERPLLSRITKKPMSTIRHHHHSQLTHPPSETVRLQGNVLYLSFSQHAPPHGAKIYIPTVCPEIWR